MLRNKLALALCCILALSFFSPVEGGGCRPIKKKARSANDPINFISAVSIADGCLDLSVQASGGCEEHEMQLTWNGAIMESFPPQVNLVVHYDTRDDPCDSLVTTSERFRLKRVQLKGTRTVILNILGPNGQKEQVTYSY